MHVPISREVLGDFDSGAPHGLVAIDLAPSVEGGSKFTLTGMFNDGIPFLETCANPAMPGNAMA